LTTGNF
jgi:radial spoke head protein 4A